MKNLKTLLSLLNQKKEAAFDKDYYIPESWNTFCFKDFSRSTVRAGEINVNPYKFFSTCIEDNFLRGMEDSSPETPEALGLSKSYFFDMESSVVYSMLPRMLTCWNHQSDSLSPGTFLKALCLLPGLKSMGVNIIYLLPVFEYSDMYKKGSLGSPYSIKDVYMLDRNLHDDLLGDNNDTVDIEFRAFVEACHLIGIHVMVDFVFRTVARDSSLIAEHPDWFYWIGTKHRKSFRFPEIKSLPHQTVVSSKIIDSIYSDEGLPEYLGMFSKNPRELDPAKWDRIVKRHSSTGDNILELIEKEFKLTTAPGYSDVINDVQPPWTDATYLRFYFDVHKKAASYIGPEQPPYILHDIVKLNLFRGRLLNKELWDYIVDVIPYYQQSYGIDGARIDMGHALPPDLNKEIIDKSRKINPNFILWSEEFNYKNSRKAKDGGFDFMTGSLWWDFKRFKEKGFTKKVWDAVSKSQLPLTGAVETPDTPRAAFSFEDFRDLEIIVFYSFLLANSVPFVNNGFEIMERQPMNLGLDNTEKGRFVLKKNDPMYGRLAFFDTYRLHWLNPDSGRLLGLICKASELRLLFRSFIRKGKMLQPRKYKSSDKLIYIAYFDKITGKLFFMLANTGSDETNVNFKKLFGIDTKTPERISVLYKNNDNYASGFNFGSSVLLGPKDLIIGTAE